MATSWLVFAGHYAPTYREREREIRQLALNPPSDVPFALDAFAARISEATAYKLDPSGTEDAALGLSSNSYKKQSWDFVESALHHALQLWHWEAMRLAAANAKEFLPQRPLGFASGRAPRYTEETTANNPGLDSPLCASVSSVVNRFSLVLRVAERQGPRERMQGWASLLRRTGISGWRNWPRWANLARLGTPRYLVYGVATELVWYLCHVAPTSTAVKGTAEVGVVDHPITGSPDHPILGDHPAWRMTKVPARMTMLIGNGSNCVYL